MTLSSATPRDQSIWLYKVRSATSELLYSIKAILETARMNMRLLRRREFWTIDIVIVRPVTLAKRGPFGLNKIHRVKAPYNHFQMRRPLLLGAILVTGGSGFIGSNFIRMLLAEDHQNQVVNLDSLSYGSNPANLRDLEDRKNYRFVKGDICDLELVRKISAGVEVVVNFAAETHVDRSISNPEPFLRTNALGVLNLLEACRSNDLRFVQVSTDEVYGSSPDGRAFKETDRLEASSPYSASKAAADHLAQAYHKTYGLKALITRCTNNFGPYQFPEKFIPKAIIRAHKNLKIPVYGSGRQIRDWIHVLDHCEALALVMQNGRDGEIYNIAGGNQIENVLAAETILKILGRPFSLVEHVQDRPGHDFRYRLDSSKIQDELGWKPKRSFDSGLRETVRWYLDNERWWLSIADDKMLSATPWKEKW